MFVEQVEFKVPRLNDYKAQDRLLKISFQFHLTNLNIVYQKKIYHKRYTSI